MIAPSDVAKSEMKPTANKPIVFVKFQAKEIHAELGRYVFSLLNAFTTSGHTILLTDNIPVDQLGLYAATARSFQGVSLTTTIPDRTPDKIYLFDVEDKKAGRHEWLKKIQVKFDVFSPYWFRRPVLMPFPIHPVHARPALRERLTALRSGERCIRVFFSGEIEGYTRNYIKYPGPKLPRLEVINTIRERLGERVLFVQRPEILARVLAGELADKCIILDTSALRVPDQDWLAVLSKADFFLAPPGIVMPMCHNSVEALAVGAVPILNYGEWFDPNLESMRNCVAFDDKESLINSLEAVLAMEGPPIAEMRKQAIAYYDAHLSIESFMASIESRVERKIEVLILTERYVAQNAHRLSGWSVLMRGSPRAGMLGRLVRLMRP
jgi:hypothetical protein